MEVLKDYLVLVFCVVVTLYFWKRLTGKKGLPPGPIPLPFIGNVLQVGEKPHLSFTKWAKQYGPIFRIKMGTKDVVVISDYKLMKELFSDNASTGRMVDNAAMVEFTRGPYGVVNAEGATWEQQRRFTLRTLRDFGFAKTSMETLILDEARSIVDWFQKSNGKPITATRIFNAPVVNSVWRMVSGERCDWEDGTPEIFEAAEDFFKSSSRVVTSGIFFAPILRFIAPEYLGWNWLVKSLNKMHDLFAQSVAKHRETFDPSNLRDYIDHHLLEAMNTKDVHSSFFGETGNKNMAAGIIDLFTAGSETTSNTLSWALLYLSQHSKAQTRLQQEIDQVIGSRLPSLADRAQMPFTEATIFEILRMSTVLPLGLAHRMIEDKHFHGYNLPKGTSIFGNFYGVHYDPNTWGDPNNFRPERFLNEDGTKCVRHPALIPFAEGKRKCIGETMAKDTLFLFITLIFQQFRVLPENSKPDYEPELGYFLVPKPFQVIMSPRNK